MDLIDYALEQNSDFRKFERLALEILSLNGYPNVKAVGGIDDEGIDAELVQYYEDEVRTTIYQFTLQDNINSKIYDTFEKLIQGKKQFQKLIVVTSNQINNVGGIRTKIRTKYNGEYELEIIEKETFVTTLAADPLLFSRYFGELAQQLSSALFEKRTLFTEESSETLTNSLLKCSLLFTFGEPQQRTKKALFDRTVLSIIVDLKVVTPNQITEVFETKFNKIIEEKQILTSIERLLKEDLIDKAGEGKYKPTKHSIGKIESVNAKVQESTKALIRDIIANAKLIYGKIDRTAMNIMEHNIKKSLGLFFRFHGLDYCDSDNNAIYNALEFDIDKNDKITSAIRSNLPKQLGEILVSCVGEIIQRPNKAQAEVLAEWSRAFIAAQVMALDPSLKEFQTTNLSKKTFLLDTDFLLYCIVRETKQSPIYQALIKQLITTGCTVVVNEDVIREAIKHAEFAEGNFKYFQNTFETVDEVLIEQKVGNVFVRGYYTSFLATGKNEFGDFKRYMTNYYEPLDAYDFMVQLILKVSPRIKIQKREEVNIASVPKEIFRKLSDEIYRITINTPKAGYRSDAENRELAETDALQFLAAMYMNKSQDQSRGRILPGDYYLVTSSTRTVRCAHRIGIKENITVNPAALLGIFEHVGLFTSSAREVVNLLDNPFLVEVVKHNWDDVKKLVDAGVSLKGKNVVRLSYDLKDAVHKHLTKDIAYEEITIEGKEEFPADVDVEEFFKFAQVITSKGYSFTPKVDALMSKFRAQEGKMKEQQEIIEELKTKSKQHAKKTQHYVNKIKKKTKKK